MYGSTVDSTDEDIPTTKKNSTTAEEFPLVGKNSLSIDIEDDAAVKRFLKNPYGETWDRDFWNEVTELFDGGKEVGWSAALNKVRIDHIRKKFEIEKKDVLLAMFEIFDEFHKHVSENQMIASFKQQFSQFVTIILKEDFDSTEDQKKRHYAWTLPVSNEGQKTILHLATERDLLDVVKSYCKLYPGHVYEPTTDHGKNRIPVEFALLNSHDATAAFLIKQMLHERVRDLFQSDEAFEARFKFSDVIHDPKMKKTVVAILDCCVNADWPYMPVQEGERKELAWSRIPDAPTRYHFYYRLLDGDLSSEPAKLPSGEINPEFDHRAPSCLQLLIDSSHYEASISHPVVRMLVNRKWDLFGRNQIKYQFIAYIIFLIFMSIAFFMDSKTKDQTKYDTSKDYFRAVAEVAMLLFSLVYLMSECDQMEKERMDYWKDPFNYFDLIGLILIFVLIPCRFTGESKAEFTIAAIAYLFNCLRVFKYFPAFKQIGIYSKTFAQIIYYDITKFALIYFIVMMAFTGSVFLSIKATNVGKDTSLGLFSVMLREVRALTEGNPFQDDYEGEFNVGIVILLMFNMFAIIVILSNILIGQLSYRYEVAIEQAEIQYSIDKTKFITKLERSRYVTQNMRIAHYIEGDYVSADNLVAELLEDWMKLQKDKTDETKDEFRTMLNDCIKTKPKQD